MEKGFDTNKRWGNSAMKGHGVNSPAMMESRGTTEGKDKAHTSGAKATDNKELSSKKKEMARKMHVKHDMGERKFSTK